MVLASKVHPIPLKFLSKEGQNSTLRAAILNRTLAACPGRHIVQRDQRSGNVGSGNELKPRSVTQLRVIFLLAI